MAELNELMQRLNELKAEQQKKEADVLFSDDAMIAIYQIKEDSPVRREIEFTNLESLHRLGYEVDSDNYELIYAIPANIDQVNSMDKGEYNSVLEDIYRIFNVDRPTDYPGYSLSVGHVIALRSQQSDGNYKTDFYYTDRYGFEKIDDFSLKLYQKYDSIRRFKFTNQPLSAEMLDILARSARGEVVTIDEINDTKEIRYCKTISENGIDTIYLSNRDDKRKEVMDYINSLGSATELDSDGHMQYNGYVERDARLDVVIGLPASGKSSAVVDVLSQEFHSRVIDNDMIKAGFTEEFRGGLGGQLLHKESKLLEKSIFRDALERNENIVFPKVGGSVSSISAYLNQARSYGYKIYLHFVHLQREKVYNRLLNRLINSGRYVEPELIDKYYPLDRGNLCKSTFDELKEDKTLISGYSEWNNDVDLGERPILIDYYNVEGRFIEEGVNRNGNNEHGRGKNASSIQADGNLRDVGSGGHNGTSANSGRVAEDESGRRDEIQQTSSSVRDEEISSDSGRVRENGERVGSRRSDREGQENSENRSDQLDSQGTTSRSDESRRNSDTEGYGNTRNEEYVNGRENTIGGGDISGDTTGISQGERYTETSHRNGNTFSGLSNGERFEDRDSELDKAFDFTDIFDNIPSDIEETEFLKGKILTILSGRNIDGSQIDLTSNLFNSSTYGVLRNVFDRIKLFDEVPLDLNDIHIETIYGKFSLSDISAFNQLPSYNMSNQNGVDWYTVPNNSSNIDMIVFNDNDIVGCSVLINGTECKVTTELVNPLYNNAMERLVPFPELEGITYRFAEVGDNSSLDITLYRDDKGVYRFYMEEYPDELPFASGTLNCIMDTFYPNMVYNRNSALKVAEAFRLVDMEHSLGFVCYDLQDEGFTSNYINKGDYVYFPYLIDENKLSIGGEKKIVYFDGLMNATDFARKEEEDTGIRPEIICKENIYQGDFLDSSVLAYALDSWSNDVEPYDYADRVADKEENISELQAMLDSGKTDEFKNVLKSYIDENKDVDDSIIQQYVDNAKNLLNSVNTFEKVSEKSKNR